MGVINSNQLRKGIVYKEGDDSYMVLDYSHQKYGRGQATIRVKVKSILAGSIFEKTYDSGVKLEEADIYKTSIQFLYKEDDNYSFMNSEDYTQFVLDIVTLGDKALFIKEDVKIVGIYLDGKPIDIELPKAVELVVTYAEDAVAGDTSSGATKTVTMETGLEINVPLFINKGDLLKINTENKDYISRV